MSRYLRLVEDAVTGSLYDELGACESRLIRDCKPSTAVPFDAAKRQRGLDWPLIGHTMVGHMRLQNVRDLLTDVLHNNIPGGFMELGVWRGGLCIYAKALMDSVQPPQNRSVYVFDAFQQMVGYAAAAPYLFVKEADVRHNFKKYGLLDDRVVIVKGLFKDTLPSFAKQNPDLQLAVLRVDSNFYDAHQDSFYYYYDKLQVGGYLIMDDFSHPAVKEAWRDFIQAQHVQAEVIQIDDNGGYVKKTAHVKIDMSKMQPPRDCNKQR